MMRFLCNLSTSLAGGLWRPLDVLTQEQVHPGGHHQLRQGVSRDHDDDGV